MLLRQEWLREFLLEEGEKDLAFVGSATEVDTAETLATKIRQTLGLEPEWAQSNRTGQRR